MTTTHPSEDTPDLTGLFDDFAAFCGLEPADFDDVAAVLPVVDPTPTPAPVPAAEPERGPVAYFPAPNPSRIFGAPYFAALGAVYALVRADGGGWDVRPADGGALVAHGRTQTLAVAAAWEATGAVYDVPEPVVKFGRSKSPYSAGRRTLSVTCDKVGLSLVEQPGRDDFAAQCGKCGGRGYLDAYWHVQGGVCFDCDGDGSVGAFYDRPEAVASVRREAREARGKVERAALKSYRERRRWEAFAAEHAEAAEWIQSATRGGNKFAGEMWDIVARGRELSAGQFEAVARAVEEGARRRAEAEVKERARVERVKRARAAGAKGEQVSVTGTVMRSRPFTAGTEWRPKAGRVIVVDDGAGVAVVVFTTARAAFELNEGDRVTVSGTVKEPENRDRNTLEIQSKLGGRVVFSDHQAAGQ